MNLPGLSFPQDLVWAIPVALVVLVGVCLLVRKARQKGKAGTMAANRQVSKVGFSTDEVPDFNTFQPDSVLQEIQAVQNREDAEEMEKLVNQDATGGCEGK